MGRRPKAVERGAAGVALVMLAAAVTGLLAGTVRNWAAVALALVGLLAAVMTGWCVVSRRGFERWVFLAASAVSLVWGILLADLRPVRVGVTLGCAALSVACAQVALRRTSRARLAVVREIPAMLPPARPVLIINPESGGGKAERLRLAEQCRTRDIETVVLRPGADLRRLAETAIACGADAIGMAGGDGSVALVASVAAQHEVPFVVVPAGTRNHFALDLGLNRDNPAGALDAFTNGVERRVDLAEVNGQPFVNNASLGLYAKIIQAPQYRDAKLTTVASLLPALLGPDAKPFDLRFTGPDGAPYLSTHLILVSNNLYQLDHIGGRGTRERLDGGTLGIVSALIDGPVQARRFTALEAIGQVRRFDGWLEWETTRFLVGSGGLVEIAIDGEAMTLTPPLMFSSRPGALRVVTPRTTPAVSPAAAAVHLTSRSTVTRLLAIAIGRRLSAQPAARAGRSPGRPARSPRT